MALLLSEWIKLLPLLLTGHRIRVRRLVHVDALQVRMRIPCSPRGFLCTETVVATKVTAAMSSRKGGYSGALSIADAPEENVNWFGIVTDQDFEPISNFKIDIVCEVRPLQVVYRFLVRFFPKLRGGRAG